jgi:hypothetical protein
MQKEEEEEKNLGKISAAATPLLHIIIIRNS